MLQPEMQRLKELHKEDKMKLQQEMMALYKVKEILCLVVCILIQIPVFLLYIKFICNNRDET